MSAVATTVKERPIIFSAPMVKAIIDGRKTQTRRVLKPQPPKGFDYPECEDSGLWAFVRDRAKRDWHDVRCPYGAPGDQLWMRETWGVDSTSAGGSLSNYRYHIAVKYKCDDPNEAETYWEVDAATYRLWEKRFMAEDGNVIQWRSPYHMPRWASRITLEITEVRVERVGSISIDDCVAEGLPRGIYRHATKAFHPCDDGTDCQLPDGRVFPFKAAFGVLWDSINVKRAPWELNPWVWALTFRRVQP